MKQSTHKFFAIILAFVGMITLGGLGNAAIKEPFYWLPFVLNLGVYSWCMYKLYKKGQED